MEEQMEEDSYYDFKPSLDLLLLLARAPMASVMRVRTPPRSRRPMEIPWAPRDGSDRAKLVVETIQGVGVEKPSVAQNSGTNFVLFTFSRSGKAGSG